MPASLPATLASPAAGDVTARMSASDRIRYRLIEAAQRYRANDNIAAYVRAGELDELRASHFCMRWRGVREDGAFMTNSVMRGAFLSDTALQREFLGLMNRQGSRAAWP